MNADYLTILKKFIIIFRNDSDIAVTFFKSPYLWKHVQNYLQMTSYNAWIFFYTTQRGWAVGSMDNRDWP